MEQRETGRSKTLLKHGFGALLLVVACGWSKPALPAEADKPEASDLVIKFLRDTNLVEINLIDETEFLTWGKHVIDGLKSFCAKAGPKQHLVVQIVFRPRGKADFEVVGSPRLPAKQKAAILALLKTKKPPALRFQEVWLRIISGRPKEKVAVRLARFPGLKSPVEREKAAFRAKNLAQQYKALRSWARKEALPVVSTFCLRAAAAFKGVRNVGTMLKKVDYTKPLDIARMTERNPNFWRGTLEMSRGNPLVTSSQVFLLVADGKLDRARRLLSLTRPFAQQGNGATALLDELSWRLQSFYAKVEKGIGEGIKLHDQGKLEAALRRYEAVLAAYPNSAWAHYQVYHARFMMAVAKGKDAKKPDWKAAASKIYGADPLYSSQYRAATGKQAYAMLRRIESRELFRDPKKRRQDLLKYAEIAADLKEHALSALIYYQMLISFRTDATQQRDILARYLYGLEQVGVTSIKKNFKGDHQKDFRRIAKQRRERMEKDEAYRAMRKKE
jgi:hypothetical protein